MPQASGHTLETAFQNVNAGPKLRWKRCIFHISLNWCGQSLFCTRGEAQAESWNKWRRQSKEVRSQGEVEEKGSKG